MADTDATISVLAEHASSAALLCDFDGTLSYIVDDPDAAVPHPEALALLRDLIPHMGAIALVSGRPVDFLRERLPLEGATFAGLYGLELQLPTGERAVDPRAVPYLEGVAAAADEAAARLPGVHVERKAGVTFALHWRRTPEREAEIRAIAAELADRAGLDQLVSRMAVELRPPVPVDKGTATAGLIEGFDVVAFAGDDLGDFAAFDALANAQRSGRISRALRIGVTSPEAPPELDERTDVVVDGPDGFVALLRSLLGRVRDEVGEPGGRRPRHG